MHAMYITSDVKLNGGKMKCSSLISLTRPKSSLSPELFSVVLEDGCQQTELKNIPKRKAKIKQSLIVDNMISNIECSKDSIPNYIVVFDKAKSTN